MRVLKVVLRGSMVFKKAYRLRTRRAGVRSFWSLFL